MNGVLVFKRVAGVGADAFGVTVEGSQVTIKEIRFSHQAHLQFISGRTLADLLSGSILMLDDDSYRLETPTKFDLPCKMYDVPYSMFNVLCQCRLKRKEVLDHNDKRV
jgi:hypothetical protein